MFYHLLYPLKKYFFIFNVLKYITFRAGCAFITSFILIILLFKFTIKKFARSNIIEKIDMYGHIHLEEIYAQKKGTPTMGGILIILSVLFSSFIWGRWDNVLIWLVLVVFLGLGLLGAYDDFRKIKKGKGLSRKNKLIAQVMMGLLLAGLLLINDFPPTLSFPFFKRAVISLGYFYILWVVLVIIASSNAVNFTDGVDGLAIGAVIANAFIFSLFSYLAGNFKFSQYLFIPYIPGAGEIAVFCLALAGAGLGFLWYNCYPAEVFMGDVGALSLGGVLGAVAIIIKKELILIISGGLFVFEAISVILQMFFIKRYKRKLFKASPFHHHLQLLGWKEPKIVVRLWIVVILLGAISLLTLKLR